MEVSYSEEYKRIEKRIARMTFKNAMAELRMRLSITNYMYGKLLIKIL